MVVLALEIPQHGAVGRARGALQAQTWQNNEELLAVIAELLHDNTRAFIMANSKKGTPAPKQLKIPRPLRTNQKPAKKRKATIAELKRFFGERRPPTSTTKPRAE